MEATDLIFLLSMYTGYSGLFLNSLYMLSPTDLDS